MNATDFAQHIGVTKQRVSYYIKMGYLKKSVEKVGGRYVIDEAAARDELKETLNADYAIKSVLQENKEGPRKLKKTKKSSLENDATFTDAKTKKEFYLAKIRKLEYEEKAALLVPVDEVVKRWTQHVSAAKTKLLGLRAELTPIVREMVDDIDTAESILEVISSKAEGICIELSNSKI